MYSPWIREYTVYVFLGKVNILPRDKSSIKQAVLGKLSHVTWKMGQSEILTKSTVNSEAIEAT